MTMTTSPPLLPLALSLLYATAAHAFQAAWHDVRWWPDAERRRAIGGRAGVLLLAAAGMRVGVGAARGSGANSGANSGTNTHISISAGVTTAVTTAISAYLIRRTRCLLVQGPRRTAALSRQSLRGRVVLVTGANGGIGYETARQLFEAGATVILGCRSEERAREAMRRILASSSQSSSGKDDDDDNDNEGRNNNSKKNKKESERSSRSRRLIYLPLDVSSLESVRRAADRLQTSILPSLPGRRRRPRLDVLVLNAGVMMSERRESVDGHEMMMAANHLGHFLLANLLLPSMRTTSADGDDGDGDDPGPARIVVLTSSTYALAASQGGIDLDDLQCRRKKYTMFGQYAQSKLANILFVRELARREEERRVRAFAVHPGLVRTDVVRNMPWYLRYPNAVFGFAVAAFQKTPAAGAWTTVYCATADDILDDPSGSYYANSRRMAVEDFATDGEAASRLWRLSEDLVGLKR